MLRCKCAIYFVILSLVVSSAGCAGLQRKFTRKKKKEKREAPVITTFDYAKELRVDELYKKHFLFWKTWQSELIARMGAGYKKRVSCYEHTVESLGEMRKYLGGAKGKELDKFIAEIKGIDSNIRKKRLTRSEKYRLSHMLEMTMRQMEKGFAYSDVKDFLELKR